MAGSTGNDYGGTNDPTYSGLPNNKEEVYVYTNKLGDSFLRTRPVHSKGHASIDKQNLPAALGGGISLAYNDASLVPTNGLPANLSRPKTTDKGIASV